MEETDATIKGFCEELGIDTPWLDFDYRSVSVSSGEVGCYRELTIDKSPRIG
jgi:hypothetical protein